MSIQSNFPAIKPTLLLDFANTRTLDGRITFTRASTATYFDQFGVMQTAASGVARFNHNPTTLESLGLLIEEQRTNLLTYSEQFDNAAWVKANTTITANTVIAPDGTLTGDTLTMSAVSDADFTLLQVYSGWTSGVTYTQTWYVKPAGISWVQVTGSTGTAATSFRNINITTGALGNGNYAAGSVTATSVGNGWYRISVTETANSTSASGRFLLALLTSDVSLRLTNVNGDGYSGIYIWGAQLEVGAFATSYIPTTSAQVTRLADAASMTGTNFSSWYNQAQGTLYGEAATYDVSAARVSFAATDGTTSNRIHIGHGLNPKGFIGTGGVTQMTQNVVSVVFTNNTFSKMSLSYANNSGNVAANGTLGTLDTAITLPLVDQLRIGVISGTTGTINGTIKKLAYYPLASTSAQLQGLTS